jgi:hypothetical protein
LSLRGEYAQALAVAERAEALSAGSDDPVLMLAACFVHAEVHHIQADRRRQRSWIERGLAIAEPLDIAAKEIFTADPQVTLLGMLAIELVRGGRSSRLAPTCSERHERARELRQPMTRLVAAWHEALLAVRLGDAERVATVADDMQALVDEFLARTGSNGVRLVRGWADARRESRSRGIAGSGRPTKRTSGSGCARAPARCSGTRRRHCCSPAIAMARTRSFRKRCKSPTSSASACICRSCGSSMRRSRARVGGPDAGGTSARRAVEEARAQEAPWLELLALVELCEHHVASAEDRRALEALVDGCPRRAITEPVRRARSLFKTA